MKCNLAILAVAALTLTGCVTLEEQRQADVSTCTGFGAEYGSPAHYQCMLIQQQRRDAAQANYNTMIAYNLGQIAGAGW